MFQKILNSKVVRPIALLLALNLVFLSTATAGTKKVMVKSGLPVMLQLTQDVSSKEMSPGQLISARVLNDVKVNGQVVISAGAQAKGQVVSVAPAKSIGRPGSISLMVTSVQAVDGNQVSLSSPNIVREGKDKKGLAWGLGIGTGILTFIFFYYIPVGVVLIFVIKGEDGKIPAGTMIDANVSTNTEIEVEQ